MRSSGSKETKPEVSGAAGNGQPPGRARRRPGRPGTESGDQAMAVQAERHRTAAHGRGQTWYSRSPDEVAAALDVDPAAGLPGSRAAELLAANGPNALPEEKPKPGWRRFLDEYRSYMQIILVAAAVVSLPIKEWSTAVLLLAADRAQRGGRPAAGGQGRERDERAQVDDEGDRPGAAGRVGVADPGRAGRGGRRRPDRRRGRGARGRPHHRGQRAADRRVGADRRERARGQGRARRCPAASWAPATRRTWRS